MHPPRTRRNRGSAMVAAVAAAFVVLALPGMPAAWAAAGRGRGGGGGPAPPPPAPPPPRRRRAAAPPPLPTPPGYAVSGHDAPADGVEHFVLPRPTPPMVVNVARIAAGAPVSLRA